MRRPRSSTSCCPPGESSAWHRVSSDEVWLAHTGSVALELGGGGAAPLADGEAETVVLGLDLAAGEVAQAVVPAHVWQRTVPGRADALVSCLVSPGFDFADFELADAPPAADGVTCNAPRPVPRTSRSTRRRRPTQPDPPGRRGVSPRHGSHRPRRWRRPRHHPRGRCGGPRTPCPASDFIVAGAGWP